LIGATMTVAPALSFRGTSTLGETVRQVRSWSFLLFGALLGFAAPRPVSAQMRSPQVLTLGGGMSRYSLGGDKGSTWVLVARFESRIGPYVVIEPGFAYMRFKGQFGDRNYLLPEISIQGQGYVGPVRPFIGGGIGFANISTGPSQSQLSLHAVTGLRIRLANMWGVRLEARARSVDPWRSHTYDFTAGIMRVIPAAF
jgi:hypothetical protein